MGSKTAKATDFMMGHDEAIEASDKDFAEALKHALGAVEVKNE